MFMLNSLFIKCLPLGVVVERKHGNRAENESLCTRKVEDRYDDDADDDDPYRTAYLKQVNTHMWVLFFGFVFSCFITTASATTFSTTSLALGFSFPPKNKSFGGNSNSFRYFM